MKREVVQDFLNLPGIVGVALLDGRSRPYFFGVDQTLNFQQKEALAQGIQQVVETTPAGLKFFEFQFTGHQVFIYKLDHGIILLVLADSGHISSDFQRIVDQLKQELSDDAANAIATFRLLAGNITLSSRAYWKRRAESSSNGQSGVSAMANASMSAAAPVAQQSPKAASHPPSASPSVTIHQTSTSTSVSSATADVTLKDLLAALNHLSQFTTQYLGTTVVTNYWKSSRPPVEWLSNFQIDRAAQIGFSGQHATSTSTLSSEQHQWIQEWTTAFIQRCSKVIRDFPAIVKQRALDEHQRHLLLSDKP